MMMMRVWLYSRYIRSKTPPPSPYFRTPQAFEQNWKLSGEVSQLLIELAYAHSFHPSSLPCFIISMNAPRQPSSLSSLHLCPGEITTHCLRRHQSVTYSASGDVSCAGRGSDCVREEILATCFRLAFGVRSGITPQLSVSASLIDWKTMRSFVFTRNKICYSTCAFYGVQVTVYLLQ